MKLYVYYEDLDSSCGDPGCCGGPSPEPVIKIFSSKERAIKVGCKAEELLEVTADSNEFVPLD